MTSDPVILEAPTNADDAQQEHQPTPPLTVHLVGGKRFYAASDHWAYQDLGVFGRGRFAGDKSREIVVLIPYDRVEYLEFDVQDLGDAA